MEIKSHGEAMQLLITAIPLSNQIKDIDLTYDKAVYFTWRSGRYKLELHSGSVDMVEGKMLIGNDSSILISRLIEIAAISKYIAK